MNYSFQYLSLPCQESVEVVPENISMHSEVFDIDFEPKLFERQNDLKNIKQG